MTSGSWRSTRTAMVVTVLAVAVAAAVGMVTGSRVAPAPAPAPSSVDGGFARDMSMHHAQAVEMAVLVRDRTEDRSVRKLALDIVLGQQQQIGQMYALLSTWGLSAREPGPPMGWMVAGMSVSPSAAADGAPMPGMATNAQIDMLASASGRRAETVFLRLMIRHHRGGVDMARYAAAEAQTSQIRGLAESIVASQSAEMGVMRSMLEARVAETA